MPETIHLSLTTAHALAMACLKANGCDEANAKAVADIMIIAEGDGCKSHGLFRLPGYVAALRSGKVDGTARPEVERIAPAVLRVNANGGFAPLALAESRPALIGAAREQGIAAAVLARSHHFAALWPEVEGLCEAGLVGLACTSYMPAVAPAGARKAFFGTNPMAFGWPRRDGPPMVFDQASATQAMGEVMIAARDGHELPPGVGLDAEGNPSNDPNEVLKGVLLPFGGYKGSAIAMMVELLAAGLVGEHFSYEAAKNDNADGGPPAGGEFLLAIDPARFGDANWMDHCEDFFARLLSLEGTRLPGARRHKNRPAIAAEGFELNADLHAKILALSGG